VRVTPTELLLAADVHHSNREQEGEVVLCEFVNGPLRAGFPSPVTRQASRPSTATACSGQSAVGASREEGRDRGRIAGRTSQRECLYADRTDEHMAARYLRGAAWQGPALDPRPDARRARGPSLDGRRRGRGPPPHARAGQDQATIFSRRPIESPFMSRINSVARSTWARRRSAFVTRIARRRRPTLDGMVDGL
jgi:hypothetical protein